MRIRALEESYRTFNYMCAEKNPGFKAYLMQHDEDQADNKNPVKK